MTDYEVQELPDTSTMTDSDNIVLNTGMLARIKYLEAEVQRLKTINTKKPYFQLEQIANDDTLVRFYTGFPSYNVLVALLGPSVNRLHYWGTSMSTCSAGKGRRKQR